MNSVEKIIHDHNRICWYPSAGGDFRELLFLSEQYNNWKNVPIDNGEQPDLFVLTDCRPDNTNFGYDSGKIDIERINGDKYWQIERLFMAYDWGTKITVNGKVRLVEHLGLDTDPDLYNGEMSDNQGNAFYMSVHIKSNKLGEWDADVLYILAENTTFAFNYLLKNNIQIDYIVNVRYGENFGESALAGDWLIRMLEPLNVKYYLANKVTPQKCHTVPEILKEKFPEYITFLRDGYTIDLEEIYHVDQILWSGQGDIYWHKVKK